MNKSNCLRTIFLPKILSLNHNFLMKILVAIEIEIYRFKSRVFIVLVIGWDEVGVRF